ncbi:unannotated protein [freshwater metagenome]|uniref:Unannotated protein n=1 Tax=freshwater metagenome TaxID=449393 RepID=A0A6J7DE90_9ZZZZ|nr:shikimate kinase [Actinomycetota bacterium]
MAPKVVLIGPPGAGKSTIGRTLGELLNVEFADTDVLIESKEGCTISEIFVDKGEKYFRGVEEVVVQEALQNFNGVLALGGGAPLSSQAQFALRSSGSTIIYLEVSLATAAPRVGFNRDRPLLLGNPRAQWSQLLEARKPIYESIATKILSVDEDSPEEIARKIISEISGVKK